MVKSMEAGHPYPRAFVTVSGAHLYGFPSQDSDVDLRGVHLLPLDEIVGLDTGAETITWTWDQAGVEADLVTHDLAKFCRLLLNRNGYVLEQLVSPLVVATSPVHEELLAQVSGLLTSNHAHHYLGFARNQWRLFEKSEELKPLLYTFRVLMTGIHLMRTGEVVADLGSLTPDYGPVYVPDLIEAKRAAEHGALPADAPDRDRLLADVTALTVRLEDERARSVLPERPSARPALHDLVVRTRLAPRG
ncbi:nucleotidyltransferase domain-containing protein [Actinomadura barringtoniae]|uniref:Nucleotidyltransferase domain-containing protein n=2 Tax=Actinomadura barringtoniae TaxID=1427535 RepID=A0A939P9U7_9ACTN|nr:nucleotidyltransferase domain-containing protein [Actinomadura barringtoniae]